MIYTQNCPHDLCIDFCYIIPYLGVYELCNEPFWKQFIIYRIYTTIFNMVKKGQNFKMVGGGKLYIL